MKRLFSLFTNTRSNKKTIPNLVSGFTLLELLIVIGIIATLSVASVIVLNPAEAMSKSRDAQRISDLNTLKKAIGIYQVSTPNSKLAGADNTGCKGTAFSTTWQLDTDHIYYSYPTDSGTITGKALDGVTFTTGGPSQVSKANLGKVDSTGWIPINFTTISGGSPISSLPIDPSNTIADLALPTNTDLVYRYICTEKNLTYEIHATLESTAYTVTDNKMAKDGGTAPEYYEVGTSLGLLTMESAGGGGGEEEIIGPDGFTYRTVTAEDGKIWLDRNLGATRVATAYDDTQAYGDLYQWGRGRDGHQIRTSGNIEILSSTNSPGHGNFITTDFDYSGNYDWRSPQNNGLWQGVNGINNPCPTGFRLPIQSEWETLVSSAGITNYNTAYSSSLKLTAGGIRDNNIATVDFSGSAGSYWSSDSFAASAYSFGFGSSYFDSAYTNFRALGFSVRCIKN